MAAGPFAEAVKRYSLTPLARSDIVDIWQYIAERSEHNADRVEWAIYEACALVAGSPRLGHLRSDLTKRSVLFWTLTRYPNYSIVYRPETSPVEVVAVVHGRRNLRRILKTRP